MKTKAQIDPAAAFPHAAHQPDDADLVAALGRTAAPFEAFLADLRSAQPSVTTEWKFSDRSGWYQIHFLKKRRLFYFLPRRDDFRLSLILGGKAVALLQQGPFRSQVDALLKTSPRYPEGTGFTFDAQAFAPDLVGAMVAAKIAH